MEVTVYVYVRATRTTFDCKTMTKMVAIFTLIW